MWLIARTLAARTAFWTASLAVTSLLWLAAFTLVVGLPVWLLTR